ncbi:hypothetical protein BFJ63_vAg18183 [Fusarium oxysporum f. sp. narcissi]|uniref:Uncharacterized protein n=2 Tax=Fusarium oxysporum TaxID=5507 RepID=A0A4Q2UY00_FUSOX|nr:hypothetical protein FPRO04_14779 [Fusarium proliferatum]RKK06448.1 hypothetical protein BFJ65_g18645 [Fusarium oxysporum f. sp. cepae]RKK14037.1 hypothetical protein BFJ67_g17985 [Fusarium oxysporum f. sp. cepae]RKK19016.1 hypothetical protein BFJ66_g17875 [Fusarium oxysporum f. sp. cepae]RYC78942.1 hypothetical protein BFJ63_vAg18183 [Fusarium oxysporum f. sp. narcissi]
MQLSAIISLAFLGTATAAAECPRNGWGGGPFANNKSLNAPNNVGQTSSFNWAGNIILVKMQQKTDSCDPEGDCDDAITYNFKNRGSQRVRVRVEESQGDHIELTLAPGIDCDLNRYFTRADAPYQISFAF